jgi:ABC-type nitrate/sulfonate/bicarbonate transport system permease component
MSSTSEMKMTDLTPPNAVSGAGRRREGRAAPRRRSRLARLGRLATPIVLPLILLGCWQLYVSQAHVDPVILPSPTRVLSAAWENRGALWANTLPTLKETLIGFALSITIGWALATICDFSGLVRRNVEPMLVISQTIPIIAIAPLFVIWFGFSLLPKVLIVALVTFFPITISLLRGFAATPVEATNLLRSMGAGRIRRFLCVRVPTALPFFFSGLRIAITFAVIGAVFGEYVGAASGLGIYMQTATNARETDLVMAAIGVTAVLSLILYCAVTVIERVALPWTHQGRAREEQK